RREDFAGPGEFEPRRPGHEQFESPGRADEAIEAPRLSNVDDGAWIRTEQLLVGLQIVKLFGHGVKHEDTLALRPQSLGHGLAARRPAPACHGALGGTGIVTDRGIGPDPDWPADGEPGLLALAPD